MKDVSKSCYSGTAYNSTGCGRYGYMNSGIGTSGVMDEVSYKKANYLVGNENGEAVLEVTLIRRNDGIHGRCSHCCYRSNNGHKDK